MGVETVSYVMAAGGSSVGERREAGAPTADSAAADAVAWLLDAAGDAVGDAAEVASGARSPARGDAVSWNESESLRRRSGVEPASDEDSVDKKDAGIAVELLPLMLLSARSSTSP